MQVSVSRPLTAWVFLRKWLHPLNIRFITIKLARQSGLPHISRLKTNREVVFHSFETLLFWLLHRVSWTLIQCSLHQAPDLCHQVSRWHTPPPSKVQWCSAHKEKDNIPTDSWPSLFHLERRDPFPFCFSSFSMLPSTVGHNITHWCPCKLSHES